MTILQSHGTQNCVLVAFTVLEVECTITHAQTEHSPLLAARVICFCPEGTFGIGPANNVDVTPACSAYGRGQYPFVDTPGYYFACLPGYVCLGLTKTATPSNASAGLWLCMPSWLLLPYRFLNGYCLPTSYLHTQMQAEDCSVIA